MSLTGMCSVGGCGRGSKTRGWCDKHYRRWKTHGDPTLVTTRMGTGATLADRFWKKVSKGRGAKGECWEWMGCRKSNGYGQTNYKKRTTTTHRVAWFLTHGETDKWILHKCDNPPCCNPEHLYEGDAVANVGDKIERDRCANGRQIHTATVDAEMVRQIRAAHRGGERNIDIARRFNVGAQVVGFIVRGQTWKHIK